MWITKAKITNYKSFAESGEIPFSQGFNVIVGKNNVGKTALIEALSLGFESNLHRSLQSIPSSKRLPPGKSSLWVEACITGEEILNGFPDDQTFHLRVSIPSRTADHVQRKRWLTALRESVHLQAIYVGRNQPSVDSQLRGEEFNQQVLRLRIRGDYEQGRSIYVEDRGSVGKPLASQLDEQFRDSTYLFDAIRFGYGKAPISGKEESLAQDASNLATVVHYLMNSNRHRFERLRALFQTVFPEIKDISIEPEGNPTQAKLLLWSIDPKTERKDLAVPLSESGTGMGQVLAILYVIVTSDFSRVILIDEPQSFLHPSAIRKLFDILHEFPQHQYIITTHSPTVVSAAKPDNLLLLRKEGSETTVEILNPGNEEEIRLFLSEVGVRLSDYFGADNILWVEGTTEEKCFPIILNKVAKKRLLGTEILGVLNTGDFGSRERERVLRIYNRLTSSASSLLPPAVGFVFDREKQSQTTIDDLIREGAGQIHFIDRRMYENYLIDSEAITEVMNADLDTESVTVEAVEKWLEANRWDSEYVDGLEDAGERTEEYWLQNVDAAKLLKDLFATVSEQRLTYDKVSHGVKLTEWLADNKPEQLQELADFLGNLVGESLKS